MSELAGGAAELGWVALKALLLFTVAVVGLRLVERRTLAQLGVFDFVVTVATGAIVGRTATSSTTSFLTGLVALAVLLAAHRLVAVLRLRGGLGRLLDRRPLVIIVDGRLDPRALRLAGLTERDALRLLRRSGVGDPADLRYALFEEQGELTLVPRDRAPGPTERAGLREAGVDD